MKDIIELDTNYSTTRCLIKSNWEKVAKSAKHKNKPEDKFKTLLFLPKNEKRQGEGGLRTQRYFKETIDDKPLITIVTVVFNGEQYLEETIYSVVNQTYDNIEYIIIDGGSTDSTIDIISKYDHAIDYWVSEKDKGIYDAMNKAIKLANGDWVNFLNSDDYFKDKFVVEKISKALRTVNREVSLVYGRLNIVDKNKKIVRQIGNNLRIVKEKLEHTLPIPHQSQFVRLSTIKKIGLFDTNYTIAADYDLTLKIFKRKKIFYLDDIVVSEMRINGVSSNWENSLIMFNEYRDIQKNNQINIYLPSHVIKYIRKIIKYNLRKYFGDHYYTKLKEVKNNIKDRLSVFSF